MDIGPVSLSEELLQGLAEAGRTAARIAAAGLGEAGSSPLLFGIERYLRATAIAEPSLQRAGYRLRRQGAALIAARDRHELQFATAGSDDLRHRGVFDAGSSATRRRAAAINSGAVQPELPGMPVAGVEAVVHLIWTIPGEGRLTGVHVGRILPARTGAEARWAELIPFEVASQGRQRAVFPETGPAAATPDYHLQPEPVIVLSPRAQRQHDAG